MYKTFKFLFLVLACLSGIYFYRSWKKKKQLQKEEQSRIAAKTAAENEELRSFYSNIIDKISQANEEINKRRNYDLGYFTHFTASAWLERYSSLRNQISEKPPKDFIDLTIRNAVKDFQLFYDNINALRYNYNASFIEHELAVFNEMFNNIEGRQLDLQQRKAIVTDEDNNVIIAGAGSGKTTTIVGKVNYVLEKYRVDPESILLISFTNKSATTLVNRIKIPGVEAKTFHKFGKDVIASVEGKQPSIYDQAQFRPFIIKTFKELTKDPAFLSKITSYFLEFLKEPKTQFDFDSQGEYIQYLKDQNFKTYKQVDTIVRGRETLRQEVVKSIEECKIANFLYFNNLDYKYETRYEFDTATRTYAQYKPDFKISQNGIHAYLEHFAVSRTGEVPSFFAKLGVPYDDARKRYWDKINWAREAHKEHGTLLLETYSYEMAEGILFDNLTRNLQNAGFVLKPKTDQEIWSIIADSAKEEIESVVTLIQTFITLMKSNNYSIDDLIKRSANTTNEFDRKRTRLFIEIIRPIFQRYQSHLTELKDIDFSDMINLAATYIRENRFGKKINYVLIDEFQDISIGRYALIRAIREANPGCKLFCVGDDWQSIYRFAGSDIALFKEFEKFFGFTVKSKIETTYRFNEPLISFSSSFILKNPNQLSKSLRSKEGSAPTTYNIRYSASQDQTDTVCIEGIFNELISKGCLNDIYILGRYSFDINRIKATDNLQIIIRSVDLYSGAVIKEVPFSEDKAMFVRENETIIVRYKTVIDGIPSSLEAEYMTVHKAKGLEANTVIIVNCNSGKHGFPSGMSDDKVLNLLLSEADQFENGEERRLFYVAMTRARHQLYYVTDITYKSKFINELELNAEQPLNLKCPVCKTADLVLRKQGVAKTGNPYKYYGCSNFLYGCEYTNTEFTNA